MAWGVLYFYLTSLLGYDECIQPTYYSTNYCPKIKSDVWDGFAVPSLSNEGGKRAVPVANICFLLVGAGLRCMLNPLEDE